MYDRAERGTMLVSVVLAEAHRQQHVELKVAPGTTARQAVMLAATDGLESSANTGDLASLPLGVFGEIVADQHVLQPGDRVELYRPLQQDPKELRRRRARQTD